MKVTDRTLLFLGMMTFLVVLGCVSVVLVNIGGVDGLTGYATINTSVGYVNVSVRASTAVTLVTNTIAFSDGIVALTGAVVNSSIGTNPSTFGNPGPFRLRNDGTVFVNVTVNGTNSTKLFGAGGGGINYSYALENFTTTAAGRVNQTCTNFEDGSPATDIWSYATSNGDKPFGITMNLNHNMVCPNMSYIDARDEFNVSIFFNLTTDIISNVTYSDVLEFRITSLGHG